MSLKAQEPGPVVHRTRYLGWLVPFLSAVAAIALLTAGLLLVRWVGATTAPSASPRGAESRMTSIPFSAVVGPSPTTAAEPAEEIDLQVAHDEAIRLAYDALAVDDLDTARDLLFLATQAMPDDPEATDRLRQVEIVQGIQERRTNWEEAMEELTELRSIVPYSSVVVDAHVMALVAVSREALERNNRVRAGELCQEAVRSRPTRPDARACLAAAGGTPGVPFTPVPTPVLEIVRPTPTVGR